MSLMSLRRSVVGAVVGRPQTMRQLARFYCEKAAEKAEETEAKVEEEEKAEDPKDEKIKELQKQLAYSVAEAENTRKIAERDVANARKYALKGFAKDLLEVSDNLERAIKAAEAETINDNHFINFKKGVDMTERALMKVFESHGIQSIDAKVGDEFNPDLHEALFNMPLEDGKTANSIGSIVKHGFKYRSRILRPTQVGVVNDA